MRFLGTAAPGRTVGNGTVGNLVAFALLCAFLALGSAAAHAQGISLTTTGTYSQNFDSLFTSGTAWTNGVTLSGWYAERAGGTAAAGVIPSLIIGSGSSNTGGVYNFGVSGTSGAALDRALGSAGSGTPGNLAYGVEFRNSAAAGTALTLGTLTYTLSLIHI